MHSAPEHDLGNALVVRALDERQKSGIMGATLKGDPGMMMRYQPGLFLICVEVTLA